jgi:hypothetical protein
MGIIKNYHDKKWTLQFLDALYNSIDVKYYASLIGILIVKRIGVNQKRLPDFFVKNPHSLECFLIYCGNCYFSHRLSYFFH